jgi:glycerol-3-phosphate acyltransferase PlsY
VYRCESITMVIFSIFVAILLVFTHRANIMRLVKGNENRVAWKMRKR